METTIVAQTQQANRYITAPTNPTYAYIGAFVDELQRVGVQHVVICPGSRSTPLALVFAAQSGIHTWMHVDERSAAFFALGVAKRLHAPVALVCTSGTAAANFLPAIVEAHLSHIPLLVLTADRPHELRDSGAPQSIDQNRLFGSHTKWFVELALPEASNTAMRYVRTIADRAAAQALAAPTGPVHLNVPLREPLTPEAQAEQPLPPLEARQQSAWQGRADNAPYTEIPMAEPATIATEKVEQLAQRLMHTTRGLIIVGPHENAQHMPALITLAQWLGYPILADPLSQLRSGTSHQDVLITSYDAFLRGEAFVAQARPELIVRFGAMPTSKPVLLYMKRYDTCPLFIVSEQPDWQEPTQLATAYIHANSNNLCNELLRSIDAYSQTADDASRHDRAWLALWQQRDQETRHVLETALYDFRETFEGRVFQELASLLPERSILYAGNSMPVRDMDTFFWHSKHNVHIMGNRGANGIDGVISSALGASAAMNEPTVLVIGDLSFYHDLNGLLAAHMHQLNLVIVLVNNNGGGIFSFLPQAAYPDYFEQLFGTPTNLDFAPAVHMYGGHFQRAATWEQFRASVTRGLYEGGLHVVEVSTQRESNVAMHRQLWQALETSASQSNNKDIHHGNNTDTWRSPGH